jgi:nicotinamide mononucleotide (NMN) deamidase PncC
LVPITYTYYIKKNLVAVGSVTIDRFSSSEEIVSRMMSTYVRD